MPTKRRALTDADRDAWAQFADRIKALPVKVPLPAAASAATPPTRAPRAIRPAAGSGGPRRLTIAEQPAGLDTGTWQRFRTGKLPAQRTLDLHGLTVQRAHHAMSGFLRAAQAEGVRCVEVVTGRGSTEGGGAIRREVPMWLNAPEMRGLVLAAVHPHSANPGSVRLLLRRTR